MFEDTNDKIDFVRLNRKFCTIAIILLISISAVMMAIPASNAQTTATIQTHCYLTVAPNPIGVNQPVNIMFWLDNTPPQIYSTYYYGWNYSLSIIDPDGKVTSKGPIESDAVGGNYYAFTPTKIGVYKIQATFLGATLNITSGSMPRGVYNYPTSQSRVVDLTVQTEPVQAWPEIPLPTGYWSFPISSQNRDWYTLAGNWIGGGSPAYNTKAPNSSHVIWTRPLTFGGITGDYGWGEAFYNGLLYENKFSPKIISGKLFYNLWTGPGMFASNVPVGVACVDMATGQLVWQNDSMPQLSAAQVLVFNSGFQSGALTYLWTVSGGGWQMYDAWTGRLLTTFVNVTSGFSLGSTFGPNGEILAYSLNAARGWMAMWNSTKAVIPVNPRENSATYKPWTSATRAWSDGLQWNNTGLPTAAGASVQFTDYADGVIVAQIMTSGYGITPTFTHIGYSTTTGDQLWRQNWTDVGWGAGGPTSAGLLTFTQARGEGVYAFFVKETMQWYVVDIKTGQLKFKTDPLNTFTNTDWSMYDWSAQVAYGKLLVDGYSGCVVAFDIKTGEHLWTFDQGSSGLETPYGTWPSFGGVTVADGKVYFGVTEHTPNTPMLRGYNLYAIDVNTGKLLWKQPLFFTSIAIAGGKLTGYSGYDNQIFCFDKGNSATSVTASPGLGNIVTIQGTVTDQSPGQTAIGVPAAGTPAISDESMDAWMSYLYLQQPIPTNATGVPVTLYVSDQSNNVVYTTSTTSDASGHFLSSWIPTNPGTYKIKAVFEGSNSYYASTSETGIAISSSAPTPIVTPTPPTPTQTQTPIITSTPSVTPTATPSAVPLPNESPNTALYVTVAAIVIIAIVATIAVILRRRK